MRFVQSAALLLLVGCYRYVPSTRDALTPGADVRLSLTPAGTTGLVSILGSQTTAVEGRVLGTSDTSYVIAMSGTLKAASYSPGAAPSHTIWGGDSVTIPGAAVGGIERRLLDSRRTTLFAILGTAAAAATVRILVHALGSRSGGGDDGGGVITP
jgi:hypothetical protein